MVIFVGDEPSSLNWYPDIAFVGSRSHPRLMAWIDFLGVRDEARIRNSHTVLHIKEIELYYKLYSVRIVALGNNASKRLAKYDLPHFKLPHPSPRNRLLNNKKFIDSELEKCKNYLRGK